MFPDEIRQEKFVVYQTAFWSEVKRRMGLQSIACDFRVRSSDIYSAVENGHILT